jgi:DNA-binding NarL/FixJ family response regulator
VNKKTPSELRASASALPPTQEAKLALACLPAAPQPVVLPPQRKITVLICDDHKIVREGLRQLLKSEEDFQVVGEAEDGRQAVRDAAKLLPDVVLIDISMPFLNGLEATRQITNQIPSAKVIILSAHHDDEYVKRAIEAGAVCYLIKASLADDLFRAIREVYLGNSYFSPTIASSVARLLKSSRARSKAEPSLRLSSRQTEILQLIAEGHPNKRIASLLFISHKTVEKHRQTLMDKLDIHEIASLTRYALANGIIERAARSIPGKLASESLVKE